MELKTERPRISDCFNGRRHCQHRNGQDRNKKQEVGRPKRGLDFFKKESLGWSHDKWTWVSVSVCVWWPWLMWLLDSDFIRTEKKCCILSLFGLPVRPPLLMQPSGRMDGPTEKATFSQTTTMASIQMPLTERHILYHTRLSKKSIWRTSSHLNSFRVVECCLVI